MIKPIFASDGPRDLGRYEALPSATRRFVIDDESRDLAAREYVESVLRFVRANKISRAIEAVAAAVGAEKRGSAPAHAHASKARRSRAG